MRISTSKFFAGRQDRDASSGISMRWSGFWSGVSRAEVVCAIMNGEVIEVYPTDRPYPSCLVLHVEAEPVHVVAAADPAARICHVITAYRPDLERFESDFRTRRKK
ncbi:MAG: DUF4258 domain-containing protein [Chromatiales bacterium]